MTEVQLQFHRGGAEFFTTEARRHTEKSRSGVPATHCYGFLTGFGYAERRHDD